MRPSVLVVDDNATMRDLLKLHLETAGYEVALAEDAVEAGWSVLRCPPSLMIVDINLPYLNGAEFVAKMKADQATAHIPVLFITYGEPPQAIEALRACVLNKPFRVEQLLAAVENVLSRAQGTPRDPAKGHSVDLARWLQEAAARRHSPASARRAQGRLVPVSNRTTQEQPVTPTPRRAILLACLGGAALNYLQMDTQLAIYALPELIVFVAERLG